MKINNIHFDISDNEVHFHTKITRPEAESIVRYLIHEGFLEEGRVLISIDYYEK